MGDAPAEAEILLVEDDPNDVKLALHAFRGLPPGAAIRVVRDGAEALEYAFAAGRYAGRAPGGPRLVLLDLKLPLVDGLEVLRRLKADPRTRAIPVVVLSASREESDLAESYRLGANSYVVKPVDFGEFTEAARQLGTYWLRLNEPPPRKG